MMEKHPVAGGTVLLEFQDEENPFHAAYAVEKYKSYAHRIQAELAREGIESKLNTTPPKSQSSARSPCTTSGWFSKFRYPRLGSFEITLHVGGIEIPIFSKLRTRKWPNVTDTCRAIRKLVDKAQELESNVDKGATGIVPASTSEGDGKTSGGGGEGEAQGSSKAGANGDSTLQGGQLMPKLNMKGLCLLRNPFEKFLEETSFIKPRKILFQPPMCFSMSPRSKQGEAIYKDDAGSLYSSRQHSKYSDMYSARSTEGGGSRWFDAGGSRFDGPSDKGNRGENRNADGRIRTSEDGLRFLVAARSLRRYLPSMDEFGYSAFKDALNCCYYALQETERRIIWSAVARGNDAITIAEFPDESTISSSLAKLSFSNGRNVPVQPASARPASARPASARPTISHFFGNNTKPTSKKAGTRAAELCCRPQTATGVVTGRDEDLGFDPPPGEASIYSEIPVEESTSAAPIGPVAPSSRSGRAGTYRPGTAGEGKTGKKGRGRAVKRTRNGTNFQNNKGRSCEHGAQSLGNQQKSKGKGTTRSRTNSKNSRHNGKTSYSVKTDAKTGVNNQNGSVVPSSPDKATGGSTRNSASFNSKQKGSTNINGKKNATGKGPVKTGTDQKLALQARSPSPQDVARAKVKENAVRDLSNELFRLSTDKDSDYYLWSPRAFLSSNNASEPLSFQVLSEKLGGAIRKFNPVLLQFPTLESLCEKIETLWPKTQMPDSSDENYDAEFEADDSVNAVNALNNDIDAIAANTTYASDYEDEFDPFFAEISRINSKEAVSPIASNHASMLIPDVGIPVSYPPGIIHTIGAACGGYGHDQYSSPGPMGYAHPVRPTTSGGMITLLQCHSPIPPRPQSVPPRPGSRRGKATAKKNTKDISGSNRSGLTGSVVKPQSANAGIKYDSRHDDPDLLFPNIETDAHKKLYAELHSSYDDDTFEDYNEIPEHAPPIIITRRKEDVVAPDAAGERPATSFSDAPGGMSGVANLDGPKKPDDDAFSGYSDEEFEAVDEPNSAHKQKSPAEAQKNENIQKTVESKKAVENNTTSVEKDATEDDKKSIAPKAESTQNAEVAPEPDMVQVDKTDDKDDLQRTVEKEEDTVENEDSVTKLSETATRLFEKNERKSPKNADHLSKSGNELFPDFPNLARAMELVSNAGLDINTDVVVAGDSLVAATKECPIAGTGDATATGDAFAATTMTENSAAVVPITENSGSDVVDKAVDSSSTSVDGHNFTFGAGGKFTAALVNEKSESETKTEDKPLEKRPEGKPSEKPDDENPETAPPKVDHEALIDLLLAGEPEKESDSKKESAADEGVLKGPELDPESKLEKSLRQEYGLDSDPEERELKIESEMTADFKDVVNVCAETDKKDFTSFGICGDTSEEDMVAPEKPFKSPEEPNSRPQRLSPIDPKKTIVKPPEKQPKDPVETIVESLVKPVSFPIAGEPNQSEPEKPIGSEATVESQATVELENSNEVTKADEDTKADEATEANEAANVADETDIKPTSKEQAKLKSDMDHILSLLGGGTSSEES